MHGWLPVFIRGSQAGIKSNVCLERNHIIIVFNTETPQCYCLYKLLGVISGDSFE